MRQRLQKIIAAAGIASRRAAEQMILDGQVTVNGQQITELGARADPQVDHIKVRGKLINSQPSVSRRRYFVVNKPRGVLSSVSDPGKRPLVIELVPPALRRGLYPAGRLDFNTEGLIILTNDGELTRLLTAAGAIEKVYHVKVKGQPSEQQIQRLRRGIKLDQTRIGPAEISLLRRTKDGGNAWYEVRLRQGKNQQIRRMFDSTGHSVVKLRRVRIGHLDDRGLPLGRFRELAETEVQRFFRTENVRTGGGAR